MLRSLIRSAVYTSLAGCGSDSATPLGPAPNGNGGSSGGSGTTARVLDPRCAGQVLGERLNGGDATFAKPEIAIDPTDGFPVVTWQEYGASAGIRVFVKKWNGERWIGIGDPLGTDAIDDDARSVVAVSRSGVITVAWLEFAAPENSLHVAQWDASAENWTDLAFPADIRVDSGFELETFAMVFGADERPLIALSERVEEPAGAYRIALVRWDGSTWQAVAEPCCESSESADLALTANSSSSGPVAVARALADGSAASAINLYTPEDGRIWLAYYSGAEVFVASWTEASAGWSLLGATLGESEALHPRLALDPLRDSPLVSLDGRVSEWDGTAWHTRCERLAFSGNSRWLALAVNASGVPYVILRGDFRENPIYVVRLD